MPGYGSAARMNFSSGSISSLKLWTGAFSGEHCIQQESKSAYANTRTYSKVDGILQNTWQLRQCLLTWRLEVLKSLICLMSYAFVAIDYWSLISVKMPCCAASANVEQLVTHSNGTSASCQMQHPAA